MYKAYIAFLPQDGRFYDLMLAELFEKEGIKCTFAESLAGYDEMCNAITSSDVYITFSNPQFIYGSFNPKAELQYALRAGIPSVIYKLAPSADYLGIDPISNFDQAAVFQFGNGQYLADFPGFVREYIESSRKNEDKYIGTRLEKPYEGTDPYAFVSYSHKDKNEVFEVIRMMQEAGYRIWYDEGIDPASEWDDNIAEHLTAAGYVIPCFSENFFNSQNCNDELFFARELGLSIMPVYLEDVQLEPGAAMRFGRLQALFYHKYTEKNRFLDKVAAAEGIDACRDKSSDIK